MSYFAPNYTQIPNLLLEEHIKTMTEAEMRVALAIARKTFGWHKRQDKLSLSQLMNLTGMSRQGVINGIEAGIARGIIRRESDGQSYLYELVIKEAVVNEVDQSERSETSQRSRPQLVNEVDQLKSETSQRSRPTKEKENKERLKKTARANPVARAAAPTPPPATPPVSVNGSKPPRLPNDSFDMPTSQTPPPTVPPGPPPRRPKPATGKVDGRKFVGGYIPAGTGANALEVFYERHNISEARLSAPKEDDLLAAITDLERWRTVVIAWHQSDYKPTNIKGQLDWYHNGIPEQYKRKEQSNEHHAATPVPEPTGRYAKLKAGKTGV